MVKKRVGGLAWLRKQVEDADKDLRCEMVEGAVETLLSADDGALAKRLVRAGELLGIRVLDHIMVSSTAFVLLEQQRKAMPFPVFLCSRRIAVWCLAHTARHGSPCVYCQLFH